MFVSCSTLVRSSAVFSFISLVAATISSCTAFALRTESMFPSMAFFEDNNILYSL